MSDEFDTTEKVERTDRGFRLTVESTRGTGTRDQDKVKAELRTESVPEWYDWQDLSDNVQAAMTLQRGHQPDAEDSDDDD